MKNIFLLSAMTITLTAFTPRQEPLTVNQIGVNTIEALQRQTFSSYAAMQPTLADFYAVMDAHTAVYGNTLFEAKNDFALTYAKKIIPTCMNPSAGLLKTARRSVSIGMMWSTNALNMALNPRGNLVYQRLPLFSLLRAKSTKWLLRMPW